MHAGLPIDCLSIVPLASTLAALHLHSSVAFLEHQHRAEPGGMVLIQGLMNVL